VLFLVDIHDTFGMRTRAVSQPEPNRHTKQKEKTTARVVFSFFVGMKHLPQAKQDSVCESKYRRPESD
jgi:hypothetical protein